LHNSEQRYIQSAKGLNERHWEESTCFRGSTADITESTVNDIVITFNLEQVIMLSQAQFESLFPH